VEVVPGVVVDAAGVDGVAVVAWADVGGADDDWDEDMMVKEKD